MKENKMMSAIGMVDDKYVEEADPARKKRIRHPIYIVIAACLCVVLAISALGIMFWKEDGEKEGKKEDAYKDSEYYAVIKVLGEYYDYLDALDNDKDVVNRDWNSDFGSTSNQGYVEVTDNQVAGVIEGDLMKRSDRYAYYLTKNQEENRLIVSVYSIEKTNSKKITQFEVDGIQSSVWNEQLYLSEDCQTLTVLFSSYREGKGRYTEVYSYDVSDWSKVVQKNYFSVKGDLDQSRVVKGDLVVVASCYAKRDADYSDLSQYIPSYDVGNGDVYLEPKDIHYPPTIHNNQYKVFVVLNAENLAIKETAALLSYSEEMYFTEDTVYVGYTKYTSETGRQTVLSALRYRGENGMQFYGSATVNGTILNQYSMDEHRGILRVVTSTSSSADLYCISLDDWSVKAKVIGFAPKGETVRSVRFDGDAAYVCTAVRMTDPVFFFDLSNLSNITYKHTGKIPGFSHSLVEFGNGYLLGIGYDQDEKGKIEIYKSGKDSVEPVCQYNVGYYISSDYKEYFIDRENGLIGFGYKEIIKASEEDYYMPYWKDPEFVKRYVLLSFDGSKLNLVFDRILQKGARNEISSDGTRAFCDGDFLYVYFGLDCFTVKAIIPDVEFMSSLEFWIGQNVDDVDWSEYEIRGLGDFDGIYSYYYGKGYSPTAAGYDPEQYVWYQVSPYLELENEKKYITGISINDPAVRIWGLTVKSSVDKFMEVMQSKGFEIDEKNAYFCIAVKGEYLVSLSMKDDYISIRLRFDDERI